jgi:hypothetical protein
MVHLFLCIRISYDDAPGGREGRDEKDAGEVEAAMTPPEQVAQRRRPDQVRAGASTATTAVRGGGKEVAAGVVG